jgi:hypothetical protein
MLRLRLPSGEETVFRSPEEFTRAVHSGAVTDEATVYHAKSDQWLPVTTHPMFRGAMESRPQPGLVRVDSAPVALIAPSPLYAEPRRQAPRGAEGLGRPKDARSDGLVLTLATVMVAIVVFLAGKRPLSGDPPATATSTLAWTGLSAPGSLALHHGAQEKRIVTLMESRLKALRLDRPLLPDAVDTPQLLDLALARLREARDTIAAYRRWVAGLDQTYADSTGRVGQIDAAPSVPIVAAQDSMYALAQAVTALLSAERGRFHSTADTVRFDRFAQAAEYDRLRLALVSESGQLKTNPRTATLVDPLPALPAAARGP